MGAPMSSSVVNTLEKKEKSLNLGGLNAIVGFNDEPMVATPFSSDCGDVDLKEEEKRRKEKLKAEKEEEKKRKKEEEKKRKEEEKKKKEEIKKKKEGDRKSKRLSRPFDGSEISKAIEAEAAREAAGGDTEMGTLRKRKDDDKERKREEKLKKEEEKKKKKEEAKLQKQKQKEEKEKAKVDKKKKGTLKLSETEVITFFRFSFLSLFSLFLRPFFVVFSFLMFACFLLYLLLTFYFLVSSWSCRRGCTAFSFS